MQIKRIVEETDTVGGKVFDLFFQSLIVFSLVTFSIETLPDLPPPLRSFLYWAEVVTVILFTIEYVLRLAVASHPLRFATSFFGVIDLLAIAPFYLSLGVDLRTIRAFRLLRLFRALKLVRYSRAIRRFRLALSIAKEELVLFGATSVIVLYLAAVGIYVFEHEAQPDVFTSVFHSLWWAVTTLTTVGYGDTYPITVAGKCFTFLVLVVGLGVVAVPAGLVASALSRARSIELESMRVEELDSSG